MTYSATYTTIYSIVVRNRIWIVKLWSRLLFVSQGFLFTSASDEARKTKIC